MLTVTSALLVTAVTMAQADQMSDLLNLPAHKHHIYILDVTSEAPVHDLKAALGHFTIEAAFKVVGENRFFFEVISNDTVKLRALSFPAGSTTTQHAVEHLGEYLEMFGVENKENDQAEPDMPDSVLFYLDGTYKLPKTICSKTFVMQKREFARQYKPFDSPTSKILRLYPLLASYPPRMFGFFHIRENPLQNFIKIGRPTVGGPGISNITVKRVVKI